MRDMGLFWFGFLYGLVVGGGLVTIIIILLR